MEHAVVVTDQMQAIRLQRRFQNLDNLTTWDRGSGVQCDGAGGRLIDHIRQLQNFAKHCMNHLRDRRLLEPQRNSVSHNFGRSSRCGRAEHAITTPNQYGLSTRIGLD